VTRTLVTVTEISAPDQLALTRPFAQCDWAVCTANFGLSLMRFPTAVHAWKAVPHKVTADHVCVLPSLLFPARESARAGRIWRPMVEARYDMQCSRYGREGWPNAVGGMARKGMPSPTCAIAEMRVGWMKGYLRGCGVVWFGEMSSNPRVWVADGQLSLFPSSDSRFTSLVAWRIILSVSSHIITDHNNKSQPPSS
jgi:hypothetical protein